jgi:hypothetical protein
MLEIINENDVVLDIGRESTNMNKKQPYCFKKFFSRLFNFSSLEATCMTFARSGLIVTVLYTLSYSFSSHLTFSQIILQVIKNCLIGFGGGLLAFSVILFFLMKLIGKHL